MNLVEVVIFDNKNRLLLQQRDQKSSIYFPGFWGLFGGACKPDEIPELTVMRELQEELSIDIKNAIHFLTLQISTTGLGSLTRTRHFFFSQINRQLIENINLKEGVALRYCDVVDADGEIKAETMLSAA